MYESCHVREFFYIDVRTSAAFSVMCFDLGIVGECSVMLKEGKRGGFFCV